MMRTLNDMLRHWVESSPETWCPWQALRRGSLWTMVTAAGLGAVMAPVSYFLPRAVFHPVGIFVWSAGSAWILLAVMHRQAGMTGSLCNTVVVMATMLMLCSNHLFLVMRIVHDGGSMASWWGLWDNVYFATAHVSFAIGLALTTAWCKDGEAIGTEFVDFLMINPLIGRRV